MFSFCCCGTSTKITVPSCPCLMPTTITQTVTAGAAANGGMFHDATLVYGSPPAALLAVSYAGGDGYFSTVTFNDPGVGDFYYVSRCSGGFLTLSRAYPTSVFGSPFSDAIRYRWSFTASGNTCSPLHMFNGTVGAGMDPTSVVHMTE